MLPGIRGEAILLVKKRGGSNLLAQRGNCESLLLPLKATLPLLGIVGLVDVCRKSPISPGGVIAHGVVGSLFFGWRSRFAPAGEAGL